MQKRLTRLSHLVLLVLLGATGGDRLNPFLFFVGDLCWVQKNEGQNQDGWPQVVPILSIFVCFFLFRSV